MAVKTIINSVGLICDMTGAALIWRYGLPPSVNRKGTSAILLESVDMNEIAKGKGFDAMSRIGLGLLFLGFMLQLVSNFV